MTEKYTGIIHICYHCSTPCKGKYCDQCRTAKGRKEQDEANKSLFKSIGKDYICPVCQSK